MFIDIFFDNLKKYPDNIAVKCGNESYTYSELNNVSSIIASFLANEGIGKEDIVGICFKRSHIMLATVIGILKSGAAFMPIDDTAPVSRVNYIVENSKAKIILLENKCKIEGCNVKCEDICNIIVNGAKASFISRKVEQNQLAYVIYTSGSTGKPKGVMIEHGGMINHLYAKIEEFTMNENSVIVQNASHCFDISIWQFLAPLLVGGKCVVYPDYLINAVSKFVNSLICDDVTIVEVVPSYLKLLINYIKEKSVTFTKLEYVISTGENLDVEYAKEWSSINTRVILVNAYGPTEASDDITHYFVLPNKQYRKIPIGHAIQNVQIYIVDGNGQPVSKGIIGEIWVSGICVGRGYVGNQELTDKFFTENPFNEKKDRLYKTGDLGRVLDDGDIEYHGRIDRQVKIKGYRIELDEIEEILSAYSLINSVAVITNDSNSEIIAFYTSEMLLGENTLENYVNSHLPSYMCPNKFCRIDELILNSNGKIDRKRLSSFIHENNTKEIHDNVTEGFSVSDKLKKILLHIKSVDFESVTDWKDDMRKLGFDSIDLIQMVLLIEEEFDCQFDDEYLVDDVLYNFNKLVQILNK